MNRRIITATAVLAWLATPAPAQDHYPPRLRAEQSVEVFDERRFARTVGAHQGHRFPLPHHQAGATQGGLSAARPSRLSWKGEARKGVSHLRGLDDYRPTGQQPVVAWQRHSFWGLGQQRHCLLHGQRHLGPTQLAE